MSQKAVWAAKKSAQAQALTNAKNQSILKGKIANGEFTLVLFPAKQNQHILGTKEYDSTKNKSYFSSPIRDLQNFINNNHATGKIMILPGGQIKEILQFPDSGAILVDPDTGAIIGETHKVTVHYSKKRTHIVPANGGGSS